MSVFTRTFVSKHEDMVCQTQLMCLMHKMCQCEAELQDLG